MKEEAKIVGAVCIACGLALTNGVHSVDACQRGEWCQQLPFHMPDLPEKHMPTGTGKVLFQVTTSASSTGTWTGIKITNNT